MYIESNTEKGKKMRNNLDGMTTESRIESLTATNNSYQKVIELLMDMDTPTIEAIMAARELGFVSTFNGFKAGS